jgi:transposase
MGHRRITPPGEKVNRNKQIVDLYVKGGYNTTEIAEYFDVPQPVVTRILHRNGVRAVGRRRKKGLVKDAVAQVV